MNEIEHDLNNEDKTLLYKTTPSTFIDRYCTKLNINQDFIHDILNSSSKYKIIL